jgi:hypothetical protein
MAVKNKFRVIEPEMNYPYQLGRNEQVLCQVLCGFSYDFGVTVIRHQNADAMVLRRISSPRKKLLAARCECMHEHFHPITMLNS